LGVVLIFKLTDMKVKNEGWVEMINDVITWVYCDGSTKVQDFRGEIPQDYLRAVGKPPKHLFPHLYSN
jgi:hypothetical protein